MGIPSDLNIRENNLNHETTRMRQASNYMQCHLVGFLHQPEIEVAETDTAVQGYLQGYHLWLFICTVKNGVLS